jgi:hypothetical protein
VVYVPLYDDIMTRTLGSTVWNKRYRRRQVLRYVLRGVTDSREISRLLNCSVRTIELDIAALKPWLHRKVEEEQLHNLRISFLQKREIWREIMAIYHRPLQNGKESPDTFRKLKALELAIKMSGEFDRIAGIGQTKAPVVSVVQQTVPDLGFKETVGRLPPDEQETLAKAIRDIERATSESH